MNRELQLKYPEVRKASEKQGQYGNIRGRIRRHEAIFKSSPGQGLPLFCLLRGAGQAVSTPIISPSTAPLSRRAAENNFVCRKEDNVLLPRKSQEQRQEAEPSTCQLKPIRGAANQEDKEEMLGVSFCSSCPQEFVRP